mmetsp:Transcript_29233/g.56573  ORF Transcript_29233/g.56573 Transcript_29233/m.56573 type:complete len:235 (+) Transcript_29233:724-1428(+)
MDGFSRACAPVPQLRGLESNLSSQKLGRAIAHFARIASSKEQIVCALPDHFGVPLQIVCQRICNQIGLTIHIYIRAQSVLKGVMHNWIVRASQNRRLRIWHLAFERIHMRPNQCLGQDHVTIFDRVHHTATGLCLHVHTNRAECQLPLKRTARHSRWRRKQRHMFDFDLTRRAIVAPAALGQCLNQWHKHTQNALIFWNPALLHPAQRRRTGCVTGQNHQIAASVPHPLHSSSG